MVKVLTPEEAVNLIKDEQTLCVEGFNLGVHPHALIHALEDRFLKTGTPRNLTLVYNAGIGNGNGPDGKGYGVNRIAREGLLKKVIAGHLNLAPALGKLISDNKVIAYNLPQGTLSHMYRDAAARKIGTITSVGLNTFIDPRQDGGKLNAITTENINEVITINGQEQLFYKRLSLDFCLLRGTYADEKGNISMEKECLFMDNLSIATAVHANGGTVIVQVEGIVQTASLQPKMVIPGVLVDAVVVVPANQNMPEVDPGLIDLHIGRVRVPRIDLGTPAPLDDRKIIGRRAAMELFKGAAVNLGVGMPEQVALVAGEEGVFENFTLTVEAGNFGGLPKPVPLFGCSTNVEAIIPQANQFDFYDGGGLDLAFLGLAQCDQFGDINVSKMGSKIPGCGGFLNIAENSRKVIFCGTLTGKGLKTEVKDGQLVIAQEGQIKKFLNKIDQITFNGRNAIARRQPVMFVTERAVFDLTPEGLRLIEVAPGIDVERDILPNLEFRPIIADDLKLMDARIFRNELMGGLAQ